MGSFRNAGRKNLMALSDEMQRLLDDFLTCKSPMNLVFQPVWRPATDVFETDNHILVRMDIAGMSEKDISVTFHPQAFTLRISGRRVEAGAGRKISCSQMEIAYGAFQRDIGLPRGVNPNGITRTYSNGFLEILIPKAPAAMAKKITVRVQVQK